MTEYSEKTTYRDELVYAVLTFLAGEHRQNGVNEERILQLAEQLASEDPVFLLRLTAYARRECALRSVSHLLAAVTGRHAPAYAKAAIRAAARRPDDLCGILSDYKRIYGKPFPNALRKGLAETFRTFDADSLARYRGGRGSVTLRDLVRICHPAPENEVQEKLFRRIARGELAAPFSWQTELSARGNTREVWDELIRSGELGYFDMLRNLRSMFRTGADVGPVLAVLSDPARAKEAELFPYRIYSAYLALKREGFLTAEAEQALEKAAMASVAGLPRIPGRTLIVVDVSGSMREKVSPRSSVTWADLAGFCASTAGFLCERSTTFRFSSAKDSHPGYVVYEGMNGGLLETANGTVSLPGALTDMHLPFRWALEEDRDPAPLDRMIFLSDNQCNVGKLSLHEDMEKYRREKNPELWIHAVDLQGRGAGPFRGERFNLLAGWSSSLFRLIPMVEQGLGTFTDQIASYPVEQFL